jgi:hypothetical protein
MEIFARPVISRALTRSEKLRVAKLCGLSITASDSACFGFEWFPLNFASQPEDQNVIGQSRFIHLICL